MKNSVEGLEDKLKEIFQKVKLREKEMEKREEKKKLRKFEDWPKTLNV